MIKKILLISQILLFLTFFLFSDIIVKQDKNGRVIVSNKPKICINEKSENATFLRPSSSMIIPTSYLNKIIKLSRKHKLREDLIIAVARAESSFDAFAVSKKGAVGIMQLMPDTAKNYNVNDRFNVDQNLEAGVKYLKHLYEKYNNIPLTLAAYNSGETAVKKYNGVPPYRETKNFIKRVMRYMGLGYSSYFNRRASTKLYKYRTKDGKIVVSDVVPQRYYGKLEIIQ